MPNSELPEGIAIRCRSCGAPAKLRNHASSWEVSCEHCGQLDRLPDDALGRVLEIKARLAQCACWVAQIHGLDRALARIYEDRAAWLRVSAAYLVSAAAIIALGAPAQLALWHRLLRLGLQHEAVQAIAPSLAIWLVVIGACGAVMLAFARVRRVYLRRVRPLLCAAPPEYTGAPCRCRACSGPLPQTRSIEITCPFCTTINLVPASFHEAQASELAREAELQRQVALRGADKSLQLTNQLRATFLAVWGVWVVLIVLAWSFVRRLV